jgi:hypothetical protein
MKRTALIFFIVLFTAAVAMPGWSCNRNRSGHRSRGAVHWVAKDRHQSGRAKAAAIHAFLDRYRGGSQNQGGGAPDKTKDSGDKTLGGGATVKK